LKPARLIIAILARDKNLLKEIQPVLTAEFGEITLKTEPFNWHFSTYYELEMGKDLLRQWLLFAPLVNPGNLAQFKKQTMAIEDRLRDPDDKRPINLDPGILTLHNLVLATTKDYSHRICLTEGIYAEVTLIFHQGEYQPLEWTYPDYKTPTCQQFLLSARQTLLHLKTS